MKYLKLLYNSFLWGVLLSVISFQSKWLEMRLNIGCIGIIVIILSFITLSILSKRKEKINKIINTKFTLINLIISLGIIILLLGFKRALIVPASIVREGLNITNISFTTINNTILGFLIISLIAIFLIENTNKKIK